MTWSCRAFEEPNPSARQAVPARLMPPFFRLRNCDARITAGVTPLLTVTARFDLGPAFTLPPTKTESLGTIEHSITCLTNPYRNWSPVPWRASHPPQPPRNWRPCAWTRSAAKARSPQFSKEMGKLAPEERKRIGKLLNAAKQQLEAALEARKAAVRRRRPARAAGCRMGGPHAARARPAPRPSAPHHAHPARTRRAVRLARLRGAGRPRSGDRVSQFRRAEHPARPSRARHAGHVLAGWRQSAAHPHFAGAGARHGAARPAAAHDRARAACSATRAWTPPTSTPSISSKA